MDLKEFKDLGERRHPWEIARRKAIRVILRDTMRKDLRVLDVGCGDGYVTRELFRRAGAKDITGVDINLTDERIREIRDLNDGIEYLTRLPEQGRYGLILLLDVIEHVEDDGRFLRGIVDKYLDRDGRILITAPAFQFLYGQHDRYLGHFRRYSLRGIESLALASNLKVRSSGYLFSTLLIPKYVKTALQKKLDIRVGSDGVGDWKGGAILTAAIDFILFTDSMISLAAAKAGIKLPGLTVWGLCERQR